MISEQATEQVQRLLFYLKDQTLERREVMWGLERGKFIQRNNL